MTAVIDAPAPSDTGLAAPWTVLCVDDEANILSALKRVLRTAGFQVLTAGGGQQALEVLGSTAVDVVVSDMRMPGMDGAALLEQVQQRWPAVMRLLLTGHADMASTVAAINRGRVFRYLQKPWDERELLDALTEATERLALEREKARLEALTQQQNEALKLLNQGLEQRVQERTTELRVANEKVQKNYLKSIKVFSNLLELRAGQTAGHCRRVAELARDVARAMALPDDQVMQVFVAGLLHDIGLIGLPDRIVGKPVQRLELADQLLYRGHVTAAESCLMALDDMQPLLPLIRAHHERVDGRGYPDQLVAAAIPLGARILAVADTFDDLQNGGLVDARMSAAEARTLMREGRGTQFDAEVLDVFLHITEPVVPRRPDDLRLDAGALEPDMVLSRDLVAPTGLLMLSAGHRLTPALIRRIREFELRTGPLEIHVQPIGRSAA